MCVAEKWSAGVTAHVLYLLLPHPSARFHHRSTRQRQVWPVRFTASLLADRRCVLHWVRVHRHRVVCVHGTARPTSCVVTYSAALLNSRFGHSSRIQWNYMSTYCEENKGIHKYNTRQKYYFHIDAIKSEIGKRSIKYKGSKLWNTNQLNLKKYSHFSPLNINFKTIYCSLWHVSSSTVLHLHLALCCLIVSVFLSAC